MPPTNDDKVVTPINRNAIGETVEAKEKLAAAILQGTKAGPRLIDGPPSAWRSKMRQVAEYRTFGTMRYILEIAKKRHENQPTVALQLTSLVIDFIDQITDAPNHILLIGLRGLAWKEHAVALLNTGELKDALVAAKTSADIYEQVGALEFEAAKARLVMAQVLYEMGEFGPALMITRECKVTFDTYGVATFRILARITEGGIHYQRKQFKEALLSFREVVQQAEIEGDKYMLATGLHNAAEVAREMGDIATAREIYPRVIAYLNELGHTAELPRVTWGYALTLLAEGKFESAISELFKVRNIYQHLGRNLDAATAELEIVRIKFGMGHDVTDACRRLVESFARSGASQNALEAFAYLREQSAAGRLTVEKIESVRMFALELASAPALRFSPEVYE